MGAPQDNIDAANQAFWDELCGSELARSIGIVDSGPEELARYDAAYISFYPYLPRYLNAISTDDRVLEIGTGYGTVGRFLLGRGAIYTAVDIAPGPIGMARLSLDRYSQSASQAVQASALALPFEPGSFDYVVAIGSLHHTGDLPKALSEVHRVLTPGGGATIMVYNGRSLNRLVTTPVSRALAMVWPSRRQEILSRTIFDRSSEGSPAPHTDFVSRAALRALCAQFRSVDINSENANAVSVLRRQLVARSKLLPTLGRVAGLDLYARLTK